MTLTEEGDTINAGVAGLVCHLHHRVDCAHIDHQGGGTFWKRNVAIELSWLVNCCFTFAKQHGVDLARVVDLKHQYNLGRARKHNKIA